MRKLWVLLVLVFFPTVAFTQTQPAPFCGVVDSFDYPIDNLVEGYDDFALYRPRFEGNHVGIDIGFDRWGDPVYAAAKGRVTLSDIEEWDTEKGLVTRWGIRVPEEVYRAVEADKLDDGIIQRNIVGRKEYGYLEVDYVVPILGGAVTRW